MGRENEVQPASVMCKKTGFRTYLQAKEESRGTVEQSFSWLGMTTTESGSGEEGRKEGCAGDEGTLKDIIIGPPIIRRPPPLIRRPPPQDFA